MTNILLSTTEYAGKQTDYPEITTSAVKPAMVCAVDHGRGEPEMDERQKLLDVLLSVNDEIDYERETALVDDGLIDSLDLTLIISGISEAFGVQIPAGEIEPENFNSAAAILETVKRYQAAK